MQKVQPVILCGGSGERLWPLSRAGFPKQFLSLTGQESLFQQTFMRVKKLIGDDIQVLSPIIVTGERHRFIVAEQLRDIGFQDVTIIVEPVQRNTAPALTMSALAANADGDDPILFVVPSDHVISDIEEFHRSIVLAVKAAASDSFIVFGISPSRPETGYGYIKVNKQKNTLCHNVQSFVEKPDTKKANTYVVDGSYYWNSGMFVMRASVWLKTLHLLRKDISLPVKNAWDKCVKDKIFNNNFMRPSVLEFTSSPAESIDYAVMEHCLENKIPIMMIELDVGWSDLGAWNAVWEALSPDEKGNVFVGDILSINTRNSLVHSSNRAVAVVGLKDIVVIETPDAVLVAKKGDGQSLRQIVKKLKENKREEHDNHCKVYRPWGWFNIVDEGENFKVKRLCVNPGASLSLQKHVHRLLYIRFHPFRYIFHR